MSRSDHDHTIPGVNLPDGLIVDYTDNGTLWDPTLSAYAYSYDADSKEFQAYDSSYPVNWLNFSGQWGDDKLKGQSSVFGQTKYGAGPNGPKYKDLQRADTCSSTPCVVRPDLGP